MILFIVKFVIKNLNQNLNLKIIRIQKYTNKILKILFLKLHKIKRNKKNY